VRKNTVVVGLRKIHTIIGDRHLMSNADDRLNVIHEVLNIDWNEHSDIEYIQGDVLTFIRAVTADDPVSFEETDPFIDVMADHFDEDHEVWSYILLE
jgi:hypothetical protein